MNGTFRHPVGTNFASTKAPGDLGGAHDGAPAAARLRRFRVAILIGPADLAVDVSSATMSSSAIAALSSVKLAQPAANSREGSLIPHRCR